MLKTEEVIALEENWTELKNKKIFIKFVAFFILLLFILFIVLLYLITKESDRNNAQIAHSPQNTVIATINSQNISDVTPINSAITNNSSVAPAANTSHLSANGQNINININLDALSAHASKNTQQDDVAQNASSGILNTTTTAQPMTNMPNENRIVIETNSVQNVGTLIKRFEATNNIIFANMISEEFFEQKNYKKSLEWALIANEKDPSNELSWIMFAKNQVKLGNKEDAIRALEGFINYAKNATLATNLLQKIKIGDLDNF